MAASYFMEQALTSSTRAAYTTAWKSFNSFVLLNNFTYVCPHMPKVDESILIQFVCFCATSLKLSYTTIKQYLSGVRHFCIKQTGKNPLATGTGSHLPSLHLVMRGIRKTEIRVGALPRLPITTPILTKLCSLLATGVYGPYWDTLLIAVYNIAFFAFLRCGEFTSPSNSFDESTGLCYNDITLIYTKHEVSHMTLRLKSSKTDPFRQGCIITLFPTRSVLCPVKPMQRYLALRGSSLISVSEPLFMTPDRNPLTRTVFVDTLRSLLSRLGLESSHYAGHSFRIGAATSAAAVRIPDHLIKTLGRWSSDCYQRYIRTPHSLLQASQCQMANAKS